MRVRPPARWQPVIMHMRIIRPAVLLTLVSPRSTDNKNARSDRAAGRSRFSTLFNVAASGVK
jgi:hypothetical protein